MQIRKKPVALATGLAALATAGLVAAVTTGSAQAAPTPNRSDVTATPIKHIVVIFDENVSFDHYFGTYPKAANTDGTAFHAARGTVTPRNLLSGHLLTKNPNEYQPTRLTPSQALTCDQNHDYLPEQKAADDGRMDQTVQNTSVDTCTGEYGAPGLGMDYYDGNTVTGLWNYAQQYAMSDNSFGSTYGPSTPGALNLIAGQTGDATAVTPDTHAPTTDSYAVVDPASNGTGTIINDPDPAYDDCSDKNHTSTDNLASMGGRNIGNLLNSRGVTWGWFQGGFAPTTAYGGSAKYAVCGATHTNVGGASVVDYSPHHNPFSYYASTANPHHLAPTGLAEIGHDGRANHNYDLSWFDEAAAAGKLPAVSFVKAPAYEDGHAGYSDPLDEQHFLTSTIDAIQKSSDWKSTAVIVNYDDSDGWYDQVAATVTNSSHTTNDAAICENSTADARGGYSDRCGPGPRLPLLVISPWSRTNFIDNHLTEQASIIRFIEQNWFTGRLGGGSFDARAGSLTSMFDFRHPNAKQVILNSDGSVRSIHRIRL